MLPRPHSVSAQLEPPERRREWLLLVMALHAALAIWLARQSAVTPPSQRTHAGLQAVIVPIAEPPPPDIQRAPSRTVGKDDVRRARPLEARPAADVGAVTAEVPAAIEAPHDREPAPAPLDLSYRGTGPREGAAAAVDAGRSGPGEPAAMARKIEQSARADCREAYSGLGLLAAPLLLVDAVRKDGCKW